MTQPPLARLLATTVLFAAAVAATVPAIALDSQLAARITSEALRRGADPTRPLPLLGSWNTGRPYSWPGPISEKQGPPLQIKLLEEGYPLIPWFHMPEKSNNPDDPAWKEYYEPLIRLAAQHRLPIALVGQQWELPFIIDDRFRKLPAESSPVVFYDGTWRVSPMSPVEPWKSIGSETVATPMLRRLQELYPDPPLVMFVSNNEVQRLDWANAWMDPRFCKAHDCNAFKQGPLSEAKDGLRRSVGDRYATLYRAMQSSMRDGLVNENWRRAAKFIGYDAFGPRHYGTWEGWIDTSVSIKDRIDPSPLTWDGGSPSYYIFNWRSDMWDDIVMSPQVEAQNWVFMYKQALKLNPDFWFELSGWDGSEGSSWADKRRRFWHDRGQVYSVDRYRGMLQWGLWVTRSRGIRDFRGWLETRGDSEEFLRAAGDVVRNVHQVPLLEQFWREGELVANPGHKAPQSGVYQMWLRPEYASEPRWFALNTSEDSPANRYDFQTPMPVLALAYQRGTQPNREWLVYAHAPAGARNDVSITVPGGPTVRMNVEPRGSFLHVVENTGVARAVSVPRSPTELVVVDSGRWNQRIAPGAVVSVFGRDLAGVDRISIEYGRTTKGVTLPERHVCNVGESDPASCRILWVPPEGTSGTQMNLLLPPMRTNRGARAIPGNTGVQIRAYRAGAEVGSGWIPLSSAAPTIWGAVQEDTKIRVDGVGLTLVRFLAGPNDDDRDTHCWNDRGKPYVRVLVNGTPREVARSVEGEGAEVYDRLWVDVSDLVEALEGRAISTLKVEVETRDCFEVTTRSNSMNVGLSRPLTLNRPAPRNATDASRSPMPSRGR